MRDRLTIPLALRTLGLAALALGVLPVWVAQNAGGPHGLPSLDHVLDVLSGERVPTDDGLLHGLVTMFWLAVAWVVVAGLYEATAWVVGWVRTPALLRPVRPVVRPVIAAAAFLFSSMRQVPVTGPSAGVVIQVEAAAAVAPAPLAPESAPTSEVPDGWMLHAVQPGDNVWNIARGLVPGASRLRVSEIADAIDRTNRGRPQPSYGGKFVDPDMIHPGWTLLVPSRVSVEPGAPIPEPAAPAPAPAAPVASAAGTEMSVVEDAPCAPEAERASDDPYPAIAAPGAGAAPVATSPPPDSTADGHDDASQEKSKGDDGLPIGTAASLALVAASVVAVLDRLRRVRLRERREGQVPPALSPELERTEEVLRAVADVDRAVWLDGTNRLLLRSVRSLEDGSVPDVLCARVGAQGVEFLVSPPTMPPSPFTTDDGDNVWRLAPREELVDAINEAVGESPALPALIAVGETADGTAFVDLEHAGFLVVEGPEAIAESFTDAMALQLTTAEWAADVQILVLGSGRLAALDSVKTIDERELLTVMDAAGRDAVAWPWRSPLAARVGEPAENWVPTVVVLREAGVAEDTLVGLRRAIESSRGRLTAIVASTGGLGANWRVIVENGRAVVEPLGLEVSFDASAPLIDSAVQLLDRAADPCIEDGAVPLPGMEDVAVDSGDLSATPDEDDALLTTVPVPEIEVGVMGPIVVPWPDAPPDRQKPVEAVVYLATHDQPVPRERLRTKLWPLDDDAEGEVADSTFRTAISRARAALGRDSTGAHHLPEASHGTYSLGQRVTSDWLRFKRLTAIARRQPPAEAVMTLRGALELVRGTPFEDPPRKAYGWAWSENLASEIEVAVAKAAELLGRLALDSDDPETAAWSARQGLRAIPYWEALHRVLMRAAAAAGDFDGVEQAWIDAKRAARSLDPLDEVQDETAELYEELRPRRRRTA